MKHLFDFDCLCAERVEIAESDRPEVAGDDQVVLQLVLELSAYPRNLAKSRSLFWHLPSTMFARIDIDVRIICDRSAAYFELRMPVATLWTLSVNACAFLQT